MAGRPIRAAKRRAFGAGLFPQSQRTGGAFLPAPVGGINTVDPAGMMKPTDCLSLTNLIPFQYGLRLRSGFFDWFSGVRWTDTSGNKWLDEIRSVLPFTGSAENGSRDRLFAVASSGIYDATNKVVTGSTYDPAPMFAFLDPGWHSAVAGEGVSTSFVNLAGDHYLAYCDELEGYMLYSEKSDSWIKVVETPNVLWKANTSYIQGDWVASGGLAYVCTTTGTSGTTSIGSTESGIVDGSCTWDYNPSIAGANPATFRFVMQWKNRLWFVVGDSANAVYLDVGAFAGTAHPMPFAPRFRYGGNLVGLWSWTLDGGAGVDDYLVGISKGGDIVVYEGTDPALPGAFGLKGVWWAGPVPPGRQVASSFGGDLFVLSTAGCLPLSKLITGGLIRDPNIYETAKVSNLFNRLMSTRGTIKGWTLTIHPTDNLLMINVPGIGEALPDQLAMSMASKGWAQQVGLPISCMTTWRGALIFGTKDGRVCVNDGYTDSGTTTQVIVSETTREEYVVPTAAVEIQFGLLSAYQNLGSTANKRVHMARPYFITDGNQPGYTVQARYNYDLTNVPLSDIPPLLPTPDGWGTGLWGTALWSSGVGVAGAKVGTAGMGTAVAIAMSGTASFEVTLVGLDVLMDSGGLL